MNISTSGSTISLISTEMSGYSYVHAIQKVTTTDTTLYYDNITTTSSSTTLTVDSYYILSEIRLPNTVTPGGYYTVDGKIYNSLGVEISVEQLLDTSILNTNIVRVDTDYIFYYYIEKYYIDFLKSKFQESINSCTCLNKQDKITIDTLTMGLDVIKYLNTYQLYNETQRIIEQLSVCTGVSTTNCNCYG